MVCTESQSATFEQFFDDPALEDDEPLTRQKNDPTEAQIKERAREVRDMGFRDPDFGWQPPWDAETRRARSRHMPGQVWTYQGERALEIEEHSVGEIMAGLN